MEMKSIRPPELGETQRMQRPYACAYACTRKGAETLSFAIFEPPANASVTVMHKSKAVGQRQTCGIRNRSCCPLQLLIIMRLSVFYPLCAHVRAESLEENARV